MRPFGVQLDDDLLGVLDDVAGGQHNDPLVPSHQHAGANRAGSSILAAVDSHHRLAIAPRPLVAPGGVRLTGGLDLDGRLALELHLEAFNGGLANDAVNLPASV